MSGPKKYCCSECGTLVPGDAVTVADCPAHPLATIVEAPPAMPAPEDDDHESPGSNGSLFEAE